MFSCSGCHRLVDELRDGLCFGCRIRTVGFTFNGCHPGHRGWHEDTVMAYQREVYQGARDTGQEIERVR